MSKLPEIIPVGNVEVTQYQDMWAVDDTTINAISSFLSKGDFVSWLTQIFTSTSGALTGILTYPFDLAPVVGDPTTIKIAGVPVNIPGTKDDLQSPHLNRTVATPVRFSINVPTPEKQNFLDYEPFTTYQLYIPFVGVVSLNARNILGKSLTLDYSVDFHTGGCTVYLYNNTETLYTTSFQIGVSIPFGSTNQGDAIQARVLGSIKTGLTLGMGSPAAAGTVEKMQVSKLQSPSGTTTTASRTISNPTGTFTTQTVSHTNPQGITTGSQRETNQYVKQSGTVAELPTLVNGILSIAGDKTSFVTGAPGGDFSQFTCASTPYLIITRTHIHDIEDYGKYFGYACAEKIKLGDHHGYCELSNIHMEGLPDTMDAECDAIESMLKTGVILP